jgi:hypothetical protein
MTTLKVKLTSIAVALTNTPTGLTKVFTGIGDDGNVYYYEQTSSLQDNLSIGTWRRLPPILTSKEYNTDGFTNNVSDELIKEITP